MNTALWCAFVAGCFFVVWPYAINKCGIDPWRASFLFSFVSCLTTGIVTYFFRANFSQKEMSWTSVSWIAFGAVFGSLGIMIFNRGTMGVKTNDMGAISAVMVVTQVLCGGLVHAYLNKQMPTRDALGFACAVLAIVLLRR